MKKQAKGLIIGIVIIFLLSSTAALSSGVKKNIEVVLNSVNLTINGDKVAADTLLYNGTTYVPLRATAEMLGKEVGWNQNTNTASINDKAKGGPITVEQVPYKINITLGGISIPKTPPAAILAVDNDLS